MPLVYEKAKAKNWRYENASSSSTFKNVINRTSKLRNRHSWRHAVIVDSWNMQLQLKVETRPYSTIHWPDSSLQLISTSLNCIDQTYCRFSNPLKSVTMRQIQVNSSIFFYISILMLVIYAITQRKLLHLSLSFHSPLAVTTVIYL
jgi:hypothetical protein